MKCFEITCITVEYIINILLTVNMKCFEIAINFITCFFIFSLTVNMKCFEILNLLVNYF